MALSALTALITASSITHRRLLLQLDMQTHGYFLLKCLLSQHSRFEFVPYCNYAFYGMGFWEIAICF